MEKDRKIKVITLSAVIIAVIGLSIAFAALSRVLNITGTSTMDKAGWDIHFKNVQFVNKTSTAKVSGTPSPSSNNTSISITGLSVTLKKPGDYVTYTADIENSGDIDAEIALVTPPNLDNQLFDFDVVYTGTNNHPTVGDELPHTSPNNVKHITMTFKYKENVTASQLPSADQTINLTYSVQYVQSLNEGNEQSQGGNNYGEEIASKQISENITATYYGGTPIAKASSGVQPVAYDNRVAEDVRYEGGTLVISGTGAIPDYSIMMFLADVSSLSGFSGQYKYNPTNVTIENGITKIGSYSFYYVNSVTNITLPDTLTSIASNAFECAKSLISVKIPSSVVEVGKNIFYSCDSLTVVYCETQEVANLLNNGTYDNSKIIVDPTKFN